MLEMLASQAAGGLGKALGGALGGDAGPFVGGAATSGAFGTVLDGSGWVVNVGGTQAASASPVKTTVDPAGFLTPSVPSQANIGPLAWVLAGVAVVWFFKRSKR